MTQARSLLAPVFAALLSVCPGLAEAQIGVAGGLSTLIDPSIRSAGMGRTGVAVFWGGDPNSWINPSLLGYYQGIRYEGGETNQLLPGLAANVSFTSNQITFGAYGIGISMEGDPFDGFGGINLDYGTSAATDVDGNVIGYFNSFEEIESFSVGVSVAQLAESIAQALGKDLPTITRYGDVSFGQTWKTVQFSTTPASGTVINLGGDGEGSQRDRGIFARVTPYNSIQYPGTWVGLERHLRARLDLSYGVSAINYDEDETISYIDVSQTDPFAKDSRDGWAVHAAFTLPMSAEESIRSGQFGWVYDLITPLLSFGSTWEKSQYSVQGTDAGEEIDLSGWELTFANIFTLRQGRINDPVDTVVGDTKGWSVGLAFDGIGGARYDHATIPHAAFLNKAIEREGFTVFFDPIALSKRLH